MSKSLSIRKLHTREARQLNSLLDELDRSKRRRAEAILLFDAGLNAVAIAQALGVHLNTIYADLHAFDASGLDCFEQLHKAGAPAHIIADQRAEIIRLVCRNSFKMSALRFLEMSSFRLKRSRDQFRGNDGKRGTFNHESTRGGSAASDPASSRRKA